MIYCRQEHLGEAFGVTTRQGKTYVIARVCAKCGQQYTASLELIPDPTEEERFETACWWASRGVNINDIPLATYAPPCGPDDFALEPPDETS